MRNRESVHKLWVALINQSFGDTLANSSKCGGLTKAAIHSALNKSSIKKYWEIFGKLLTWFKDTVDFTESEDKTKLTSFATALISASPKNVWPLTCTDKIGFKGKAKNFTRLKKQVKVND